MKNNWLFSFEIFLFGKDSKELIEWWAGMEMLQERLEGKVIIYANWNDFEEFLMF